MKKIAIIILFFGMGAVVCKVFYETQPAQEVKTTSQQKVVQGEDNPNMLHNDEIATEESSPEDLEPSAPVFSEPIVDGAARITKKPFGIYIDPATSPVQSERFAGYHSGTDFEMHPGERGQSVAVRAICSGEITQARWVSGYGGVVVQRCSTDIGTVSVLYGHVALSTLHHAVGTRVTQGEQLVLLGEVGPDTDGERKHLHLGITRGGTVNVRGYVQKQHELTQWHDYEALQ